jgi:thiol-disulfide isomerase/thioredoxin
MKIMRISRIVLILAGLALTACRGGDSTGFAPDFALTSPDGKTVTLSSKKGRVVLLNFWATWCDSCKEEIPVLKRLSLSQAADGFELLSVSVDDDPTKAVPPFAAKYAVTYPLLYADRRTMDAYAVRMLPTTFLIAADGSIVRRYVGPLDAVAVENDILSLLHRRPS